MKTKRNEPCPCGSGKKYKKCCWLNTASVAFKAKTHKTSNFDGVINNIKMLTPLISKYSANSLALAIFCLNSWRRNRSSQTLKFSLNGFLINCKTFGNETINSYSDFKKFYTDITEILKANPYEDFIIDDYGEVFINHLNKNYPIIIGTGHQQVYAALRYMQELVQILGKNNQLTVLLEYLELIINSTKDTNAPINDATITFELPSEDYWNSICKLFQSQDFINKYTGVSKIIGFDADQIESCYFIQNSETVLPLYNEGLLIDYYALLLKSATPQQTSEHIDLTIYSLIENSFDFNAKTTSRILVNPSIVKSDNNEILTRDGIVFACANNDRVLIAIDNRIFKTPKHIKAFIDKIDKHLKNSELRLMEKHSTIAPDGSKGLCGFCLDSESKVLYMCVTAFTNITTPLFRYTETPNIFNCTALDLLYFLGFSTDAKELIEYVEYSNAEKTMFITIGGKSNHFFTWKNSNRIIASGAIEYTQGYLDYNTTEDFIFSFFKNTLCQFPKTGTGLFADPLNWTIEITESGSTRVMHKGCLGFGGNVLILDSLVNMFFAHNVEFYEKEDFVNEIDVALEIVDGMNEKLFKRYAHKICNFEIIQGKTFQLLFMPWNYAQKRHYIDLLSDTSRKFVYSAEYVDKDSVILRYTINPTVLLKAIENAKSREVENEYLKELLLPLHKYCTQEYEALEAALQNDKNLKKTVDVFTQRQYYYFSDEAISTDIDSTSRTKSRKEIAKACLSANIEFGEYKGKKACEIIRSIQAVAVKVFEEYISKYDMCDLHKKALNYFATQKNNVILNKHRYSAFDSLDEDTRAELEEKTIEYREKYRHNVKMAEYLLESNLAISHTKHVVCSKTDFQFLLAFSDDLLDLQNSADLCRHLEENFNIDSEILLSIDSEYRPSVVTSEEMKLMHDSLIARKYSVQDYAILNDEQDKKFFDEATKAFFQDTGVDFDLLTVFLRYLELGVIEETSAEEIYPNVFSIEKNALVNAFNNTLIEPLQDLKAITYIIDFLTIDCSKIKSTDGTQHNILPIWERKKRSNRIETKPIVQLNGNCIFSPISMDDVLTLWISGISEWYLPYEKDVPKVLKVVKNWKKRYEDKMSSDISLLFEKAHFDISIPEVDLQKRFPDEQYPQELGDYDVLAIHKNLKQIWIIESKVLSKVGSIYEDQMQQKSFFFQNCYDEKFQRRIDYVINNTDKILASFGINDSGYEVIPYMVTNKLFASRYKKINFSIVAYSEFEDLINKEFIKDPYVTD